MADYPVPVSGRISEDTGKLVAQAKKANALLTTGTLVRMAMESFMPRYVKTRSRAHAELLAGIEAVLTRDDPGVEAALEALAFGTGQKGKKARR